MVEVGRNIGAVNFLDVPSAVAEKPVTLAGVINGVELSELERRAVLAADAMFIPLDMKGVLVGADICIRSGVFRAGEVLGFDQDQAVEARNAVRIDPEYGPLWAQFDLLRSPGILLEVAVYRRAGKTGQEIAEVLGIEPQEVDRMAKRLVDFGIGIKRTSQQRRFGEFCREVEAADRNARGSLLPTKELALVLSTSAWRVDLARRRNRNQAIVSTPGRKGVSTLGQTIRRGILSNPQLSDSQVFEKLKREGMTGLTEAKVTHRRRELIEESRVQPKLRRVGVGGTGVARMLSKTEEAESILRAILPGIIEKGEPVILSEIYASTPKLARIRISRVSLYNVYHRLEKELGLPPLKVGGKKRRR